MATRRHAPKSSAKPSTSKPGATKTSARSTNSGPAHADSPAEDRSMEKMQGTEELAASFPFNAAKPSEYGKAAFAPSTGQTVEPTAESVTGSTLSEVNDSPKVGRGVPPAGI